MYVYGIGIGIVIGIGIGIGRKHGGLTTGGQLVRSVSIISIFEFSI